MDELKTRWQGAALELRPLAPEVGIAPARLDTPAGASAAATTLSNNASSAALLPLLGAHAGPTAPSAPQPAAVYVLCGAAALIDKVSGVWELGKGGQAGREGG